MRRGAARAGPSPRRAPRRAGRRAKIPPATAAASRTATPASRRAQAAVGAPGASRLLLGGLAALGDELALELVDVERVIGGPVEGGSEAGAAVELALIAPCRVPFRRRLGDVTAKPAPFGVLLDPLAQARPLAQQRLVGDLDDPFRHGDETAVGQRREHVGHVLVALQVELRERSAAAHRRVALVLADQAQHDRAHERPALVGDASVRALGQPRNGAVDAAGLAVGSQGERVAPAASARARAGRWTATAARLARPPRRRRARRPAPAPPAAPPGRRAARRRAEAPRPASARPAPDFAPSSSASPG